jgi:hypothetical protein
VSQPNFCRSSSLICSSRAVLTEPVISKTFYYVHSNNSRFLRLARGCQCSVVFPLIRLSWQSVYSWQPRLCWAGFANATLGSWGVCSHPTTYHPTILPLPHSREEPCGRDATLQRLLVHPACHPTPMRRNDPTANPVPIWAICYLLVPPPGMVALHVTSNSHGGLERAFPSMGGL